MNELGECYICTLESAPLSPCDCINMYLHYNCQIKLIHEKGEKCTVCLKEFNNVEVITKINYYYTFHTKSAFCMIILGINIGGAGLFEIYLYSFSNIRSIFVLVIGNLFLVISFSIGIMMYRIIKQLIITNRFYEIKIERIINLKT